MLLTISGSSCSGKTTTVRACGPLDGLVRHDFDEIGVPGDADVVWRQRLTERDPGRWDARSTDAFIGGRVGSVRMPPTRPTSRRRSPPAAGTGCAGTAGTTVPLWPVTVIDTTGRPIVESAAELRRWIDAQRQPANQDIA